LERVYITAMRLQEIARDQADGAAADRALSLVHPDEERRGRRYVAHCTAYAHDSADLINREAATAWGGGCRAHI
jgi:hypothetical protein